MSVSPSLAFGETFLYTINVLPLLINHDSCQSIILTMSRVGRLCQMKVFENANLFNGVDRHFRIYLM